VVGFRETPAGRRFGASDSVAGSASFPDQAPFVLDVVRELIGLNAPDAGLRQMLACLLFAAYGAERFGFRGIEFGIFSGSFHARFLPGLQSESHRLTGCNVPVDPSLLQ
jgi:hypothetical protein